MTALLSQNMAVLVTGTVISSRAFINQIYYFVTSAIAIYLVSHIEVPTDFCFVEHQQIVELLR
jgi:hypothetical protein